MTTELLAIDPTSSVRALWSRRWTLALVVALAAAIGYGVSLLLPAVWVSDAAVELGQVNGESIENGATLVRRINVGRLPCGSDTDAESGAISVDQVEAQLAGPPDF